MNLRHHLWPLLMALFCVLGAPARGADDEKLQNPALKPFYGDLRMLFYRHYPEGTSHLLKDKIHFEQDTRIFITHEPTKTGEWQDPGEERGPQLGGILCDMTLQPGRYQGAAATPQTFDKRYYSVLFLAPYSPKLDAHLIVHLAYPRNVDPAFLKAFAEMISNFEKPAN